VATPSEAFSAIDAGAHGVKAFPAEMVTPAVLKSWKSVLPATLPTLAVGGIDTSNIAAYWHAGANGFGLGGALYKAGKSKDAVAADAQLFVTAMRSLMSA
jgi:2-dehydro-3-deoxyphosphogalactonate aldolase